MAEVKLSVRELVEFLLRTGSIDSRFAGFDRANEGARGYDLMTTLGSNLTCT